ncbi:uncharacterized protein LOC113795514 isoform X2 [Dermatophagoides pteronyssinus]|uniref:uncharacterized protein LOC113795514 isoform X2 n=1 Tax=Dermatophagoides pteronyssinus TaxID=6956 RepID=UPI003F67C959
MKSLLLNQTLKIAYTNTLPYTKIDHNHQSGIEFELLKTLSDIFQFKMIFVDCKNDFGIKQSDGNWTGVIGKIFNHEADIGIDSLTFGTAGSQKRVPLNIFFQPFTSTVWFCLFISLILFPILNLYHQHEQNNHYAFNLLWINLSLLLRQPYYPLRLRLNLSSKINLITWMLSLIILANIYSSYLCAQFAIQQHYVIDTCEKLADACDDNEIIPLLPKKGVLYPLFKTNSSIRTIRSLSRKLRGITDHNEGARLVVNSIIQKERYALISSYDQIKFSQFRFKPESIYLPPASSKSTFFSIITGFPVRLPENYIKHFEIWIMRISSFGLMKFWKNQITRSMRQSFFEKKNVEQQFDSSMETDQVDQDFNLNHFDRLTYLFLFGILLSIIIFINEFIVYRFKISIKLQ